MRVRIATEGGRALSWLEANGLPVEELTDHDRACLRAITEIAVCWTRGDLEKRKLSALAFGSMVAQLRLPVWWAAFHVTAMVSDWSHRRELWTQAGLPTLPIPRASGGPEAREPKG